MSKTIVIDPGHGGTKKKGNSSPNNATSASGVKEKDISLDLAMRIRWSLEKGTAAKYAKDKGKNYKVVLTRTKDKNISLMERASVASKNNASLYLSLHFNGFNKKVRGTECWIDRKYIESKVLLRAGSSFRESGPGVPSSGLRNINVDADADFAKKIVDATYSALREFDSGAKLRKDRYTKAKNGEAYNPPEGVKMDAFGTLRDAKLGTKENNCRAALLEVEFIDNPDVDRLLVGGETALGVRNRIAGNIAKILVDEV